MAKIANADPLGERAEDTLDDNGRLPCYVCPIMDAQGWNTATDRSIGLAKVARILAGLRVKVAFDDEVMCMRETR